MSFSRALVPELTQSGARINTVLFLYQCDDAFGISKKIVGQLSTMAHFPDAVRDTMLPRKRDGLTIAALADILGLRTSSLQRPLSEL